MERRNWKNLQSFIAELLSMVNLPAGVCNYKFVVSCIAVAGLGVVAVFFGSVVRGNPLSDFFRDPASVKNYHPFVGVMSTIGVLLWCAAGVCTLFASTMVRSASDDTLRRFVLWSGILSLGLMFDDQFLVHEQLFQDFFGIGEHPVVLTYLLLIVLYLFHFRNVILKKTPFVWLACAFFFFSISVRLDFLLDQRRGEVLEDVLKFFGIVFWFGYFWSTSSVLVASRGHISSSAKS
jgi:hypothetical protein